MITEQTMGQQMNTYYKHIFPYEQFFEWLSYKIDHQNASPADYPYISRREFSFEADFEGTMVYNRYNHFTQPMRMQNALVGATGDSAIRKIDIGAVFDTLPSKRDKCTAIEKELVIDIDMNDYDEVRTCCEGATICKEKCWKFLILACEILYRTLTEDFGFQHILWVYSGRRGIHLWICDEHVRRMPNNVRKGIIGYLSLNQFRDSSSVVIKKMKLANQHPAISKAVQICMSKFDQIIIQDQQSLIKPNVVEQIKNLMNINKDLDKFPSDMIKIIDRNLKSSEMLWRALQEGLVNHKQVIDQIVLMCLYPRLDANVSTTINHLLKAPFCVHPKTGKVCVPFTVSQAKHFNPDAVPTLNKLLNQLSEIDQSKKQPQTHGDIKQYPNLAEQTDLKEYIQIFEDFLDSYKKEGEKKNKLISKGVDISY